MRHFATESGKSKGQFYTPAEVSRVMAQVVGISADTRPDQTIYDPTYGSGSLILKAADEAPRGLTIYGQETASLRPRMAITPFCSTSAHHSRAKARARSSCPTVCCFGATKRPISAGSSSSAA